MDLYTLHAEIPAIETEDACIQPVTTLRVPRIVHPDQWFHCIRWTRYRKYGHEGNSSLEWFVRRGRDNSNYYYSVGEDGTTLISTGDGGRTHLTVHPATVHAVAGLAKDYCCHPTLEVLK